MKKHLKVNDWHICIYAKITDSELAEIEERMVSMNVPKPQQELAHENLQYPNRGTTIANSTQKCILVTISPQTSKAEMINTISHELRHVVDILCVNCNLENAAALTGEIAMRLSDWI